MPSRKEQFERSLKAAKQTTALNDYKRKSLKAYLEVLPAFYSEIGEITKKEFKNGWYDYDSPIKYITNTYANSGLRNVRVYPGRLQSWSMLIPETADPSEVKLFQTGLWKFLLNCWQECEGFPIVLFYIKGNPRIWVLTNDLPDNATLIPRVRIPSNGLSANMEVMSLQLFISERQTK